MDERPKSFQLTLSHKIYLAIVALMVLGTSSWGDGPPSYMVGQTFGRILVYFAMPYGCAAIAFRLRGRRPGAGSGTFHVVLTLLVIGTLANLSQAGIKREHFRQISESKAELYQKLHATDSPEEVDDVLGEYQQSVDSNLAQLAAASSGEERRYYLILQKHLHDVHQEEMRFAESCEQFMQLALFEPNRLKGEDALNEARLGIQSFQASVALYREHFDGVYDRAEQALSSIRMKRKAGELAELQRTLNTRTPVVHKLCDSLQQVAQLMLVCMDFLEEQQEEWDYDSDGAIHFNKRSLQEKWLELGERVDEQLIALMSTEKELINTFR